MNKERLERYLANTLEGLAERDQHIADMERERDALRKELAYLGQANALLGEEREAWKTRVQQLDGQIEEILAQSDLVEPPRVYESRRWLRQLQSWLDDAHAHIKTLTATVAAEQERVQTLRMAAARVIESWHEARRAGHGNPPRDSLLLELLEEALTATEEAADDD